MQFFSVAPGVRTNISRVIPARGLTPGFFDQLKNFKIYSIGHSKKKDLIYYSTDWVPKPYVPLTSNICDLFRQFFGAKITFETLYCFFTHWLKYLKLHVFAEWYIRSFFFYVNFFLTSGYFWKGKCYLVYHVRAFHAYVLCFELLPNPTQNNLYASPCIKIIVVNSPEVNEKSGVVLLDVKNYERWFVFVYNWTLK